MGWMDAEGYLYLTDRDTDMILVGGANVYPAEVESALEEHPRVRGSCVIGLPDEDLGHVVHAIIQVEESAALAAPRKGSAREYVNKGDRETRVLSA
jgi:bile acid-coenzyme A ligase